MNSPFSPARVAVSETFPLREIVTVQIRAGRGRVHRHANPGFGSLNPDRTIIVCKYQSAPRVLLPTPLRGRRWSSSPGVGRYFAGLTLRQLWAGMKRCFSKNALPALFCPGTGGTFLRGVVNSCAAIGRHSLLLRALLNALQKPSRRVSDAFHSLLLFAALHEQQTTTGEMLCPTKVLKEPTK